MPVESRFQRLQSLFDAAAELAPAAQQAFVDTACADDDDLRAELLRLLERERSDRGLSDTPMLPALDSAMRKIMPDAFDEGRQVGPFKIIAPLGDGGMGRVFHAERDDGEVRQQVAIKLVRAELLTPALLARFSTERQLLAALNHPNICRFLDAGTLPDGMPYVAMELVAGQPLFQYCDQHRLSIAERLRLLRKIVAAVGHAHRQLIVHRDIKSSNVLIDANGEPKLLDFGIGKWMAGAELQQTATAERFFTPTNAAPEQLRGEAVGVGCDIYALGLLAYELLSGRPPFDFDGLRPGEIERLLLDVPAPSMSQRAAAADTAVALRRQRADTAALARALSGDLDAVVSTCLRKAPAERYYSTERLDADLRNVLELRPVRSRRGERGYRLRLFVARHRLAVALSTGLVVTLLIAVAVVSWQAVSLTHERNRIVIERDRAQHLVTLLKESFIGADPARVAGDAVTLSDVLASARPRIEALHDSQPTLYASLAATLAEVELGLGRDGSAAALAERAAVALIRGEDNPALLRSLLLTEAVALTRTGDHPQAVQVLDAVRRMDPVEQPDWMVASGRSLGRRGQYRPAIDMLRRAVEQLSHRGPDDELVTTARQELAYVLRIDQQPLAALEVSEATLAWQRASLAESDPNVVRTRLSRADLLVGMDRAQEAVDEAEQVKAAVTASYGQHSPMTGRAEIALAMALDALDRVPEALEHMRSAVHILRAALGSDHAQTIRATFNLSQMLQSDEGGTEEALQLLNGAVSAAESRFGASADSTHFMRNGLASLLVDEQRWTEALSLLTSEAALTGLSRIHSDNRSFHLELLESAAKGAGCPRAGTAPPAPECATAVRILAAAPAQGASTEGSEKNF